MKLFKTGSIDVVKDCQSYFATDLPSCDLKRRQDKFILRYICFCVATEFSVNKDLYDESGTFLQDQLAVVCSQTSAQLIHDCSSAKHRVARLAPLYHHFSSISCQLLCTVSLSISGTIHLFLEIWVFSVKCLIGEIVYLISGRLSMSQQYFVKCHHHRLSDVEKTTISLLYEFINLIETITLCFLVILILFIPIFCSN